MVITVYLLYISLKSLSKYLSLNKIEKKLFHLYWFIFIDNDNMIITL
ncbi:hypothetical protein A1OE_965 [Candidatus Endolissoclinum faulkneri L2]|uniref:Uncharacterized protein n=1 Tax=Candidatus Endolissoclinum faulkneri L2 TaxID=1193729 RepID=K7ZD35_9PROT|nr:hypothetical protein A1OE_965 [Candidatus Endolissoclinum faulkneri L2]